MNPNFPKKIQQCGFTLLEVLIALGITAVIATIAYQSLSSAADGAETTRRVFVEVNQLDRAYQLISADLRQVLTPEPGPHGTRFVFAGGSLRASGEFAEQGVLLLSRRGWSNLLERERSDLQRVAYRVSEGKLYREFLPERNLRDEDIDFVYDAYQQTLLEDLKDIQVRFLSKQDIQNRGRGMLDGAYYSSNWEPEWPSPNAASILELPIAVEVTIELEGASKTTRLFEVGQ